MLGTGAAATAFLPARDVSAAGSAPISVRYPDAPVEGDLPPFPDNWVDKVPRTSVNPSASPTPVGTVLKEYRLVGCPMFGCTQRNVNGGWEKGWYYSFRAPRTGTITKFMWQTQGAREHADPGDEHSHGNFGRYTVKFYAYSGFGSNKGSQLAQGRFESGESRYYPGWQKNSTGTSSPPYTPAAYPSPDLSHYGGRPETAELRGGLHVHAYLNRTLLYDDGVQTYYPYAGTAYVYIDVDRFGGGSWSVDAGDWIIAEFVNDEPRSGTGTDNFATNNFSADNNASSISAPRPGNTTHQCRSTASWRS